MNVLDVGDGHCESTVLNCIELVILLFSFVSAMMGRGLACFLMRKRWDFGNRVFLWEAMC